MSVHEEELLRRVPLMNEKRGEELLRHVWNMEFRILGWEEPFIIDESLPSSVVKHLHLMPAEMTAALDCWHEKMVAAIDEVVQRLKAEAAETPTPSWILER